VAGTHGLGRCKIALALCVGGAGVRYRVEVCGFLVQASRFKFPG
jgi:hypothetical protein